MYLKKICIVSNVIGNKDVIENEVNGFICNGLNDYVEVINRIKSLKYDLNKIFIRSVSDIKNVYNTKVMSESYYNLYMK